jgi:hypothetical protein
MAVPSRLLGDRLDKFVMSHLGISWIAAHKLIRTKRVFVAQGDGVFIYRDSAYKLQDND